MTAAPERFDEATLDAERGRLMSLAYRMLGTVADAEDVVQETYARWYRLSPEERDAIENPAAWLTRVASRICLDQLGSARARRERYVGEWLPEPLPGGTGMFATRSTDPLDRVALDESVSTALLVVLESLTPAERVAFVLHDVFAMPFDEIAEIVGRSSQATRKLASTARRHVRERRAGSASREQHDAVVRAFIAASETGDLQALLPLLDPDVVLVSDGGGLASAARRPVLGPDHVGRFIVGQLAKLGDTVSASLHETPDGLAVTFAEAGAVTSVAVIDVRDERISNIWVMRNPEKLALWNR